MICFSNGKLRKRLFWTNNKFVFFFNCTNWEKFVDKIGETNWWKHLMNSLDFLPESLIKTRICTMMWKIVSRGFFTYVCTLYLLGVGTKIIRNIDVILSHTHTSIYESFSLFWAQKVYLEGKIGSLFMFMFNNFSVRTTLQCTDTLMLFFLLMKKWI